MTDASASHDNAPKRVLRDEDAPGVVAIAVVATNGVIGDGHDQPFKFPEDWARFKERTTGNFLVMGRETFEQIGRPLPNRTTIVVTRNPEGGWSGTCSPGGLTPDDHATLVLRAIRYVQEG